MDGPKRRVFWLESVPPDIWASFVKYLAGEDIARLIITGAMLLRLRLKSPTVVKSITLGKGFVHFNSWPRFVNDFSSLEELTISSCYDEWSSKLDIKIDKLPSGLRKLKLSGHWNLCADQLFGENGSVLKLNEHLPRIEILNLKTLKFGNYAWLRWTPPCLTQLKLYHWDGTVKLPTSLIRFEAWEVDLSKPFATKLPYRLESFVTYVCRGVELLIRHLPASTRELSFRGTAQFSGGRPQPQKLLKQLPSSLTSFTVPPSIMIKLETTAELTWLLPRTLTDLTIDSAFPWSACPALPPHLKTLSLNLPWEHSFNSGDDQATFIQLPSLPFEAFPHSITSLQIRYTSIANRFCGPPATSPLYYFPPRLTSLKIPNIQLSPHTAKLLPVNLSYLMLGNFCEQVCMHLPTGLRTLISHRTLLSSKLIKFLPTSLTSLDLQIPNSYDIWFDHRTGQRTDFVSILLDRSTHDNQTISFDVADGSDHLKLQKVIRNSILFDRQIPNLLSLELRYSMLTDSSIPLLPRNLTNLGLRTSSKITGTSFQYLPRCLTTLSLQSSKSIFDSDIQHLPQTLTSLFLPSATHLTDLCVPDLPPHLSMLIMCYNTLIAPSSFPNFPSPIRSSQLGYATFSKWIIHFGMVCTTCCRQTSGGRPSQFFSRFHYGLPRE